MPDSIEGQSFRNEALTGSGTILPDGTYGEPLPDPTEVRGLGADKTNGGRTVPSALVEAIPDALIVDRENSTAASETPATKPAAAKPKASGTTAR
jgi:hypothetical protein